VKNPIMQGYIKEKNEKFPDFVESSIKKFTAKNNGNRPTHAEVSNTIPAESLNSIRGLSIEYRSYIRPDDIMLWREE